MNHESCGRCGRKLKTEKSKEVGYGPVCHKKVLAAAEEVPVGQTVIDEFIENEKEQAIKVVGEFIKKRGYTYTVEDIVKYYLEYWKKGHYVSYTMRDCIENLKDELEDIIEE